MTEKEERSDRPRTARDLLRFLDELLRAIARVELGNPGVAQLTLLEMRILTSLAEAGKPVRLSDLADRTAVSNDSLPPAPPPTRFWAGIVPHPAPNPAQIADRTGSHASASMAKVLPSGSRNQAIRPPPARAVMPLAS
jgi:hypothetical protein